MDITERNHAVWAQVLDKRYCTEVIRTRPYYGDLRIFDSQDDYKLIYNEEVVLSFDAKFGPDVSDTYKWCDQVAEFVDGMDQCEK
jgi:hypothetical protein